MIILIILIILPTRTLHHYKHVRRRPRAAAEEADHHCHQILPVRRLWWYLCRVGRVCCIAGGRLGRNFPLTSSCFTPCIHPSSSQPFDLVKVRMQTAPDGFYKGTLDCFTKTVKTDGIRGLYRGMSTPLIGVTPIFAVSFWVCGMGQCGGFCNYYKSSNPTRIDRQLS